MSSTAETSNKKVAPRKSWRRWGVAAVVVLMVPLSGLGYLYWTASQPLQFVPVKIVIEPGNSLTDVAGKLQANGAISNVYAFIGWAYWHGQTKSIKAGEYQLQSEMSAANVLDHLVAGQVVNYPLTLIEGWTFRQFLEALRQSPKVKQTLTDLSPAQVMARLDHPESHPEGRFYPDTYLYMAGSTDISILQRAFRRMQTRLQEEWAKRSSDLLLKTPDEALVLASVVEKETGLGSERKKIAGVLINRLKRGMRLQTDPTVIYGLGADFDGNLTRQHLRADTPYNTYTRHGLPPTPIAMPGGAALHAVMHPQQTSALYFVAKGDGSHAFSETLPEHNRAVIKYQLGGKAKQFSSYADDQDASPQSD